MLRAAAVAASLVGWELNLPMPCSRTFHFVPSATTSNLVVCLTIFVVFQ